MSLHACKDCQRIISGPSCPHCYMGKRPDAEPKPPGPR